MRKISTWIGVVLGSLVGLLLIVALALYVNGGSNLNATYEVQAASLTLPTDSASIARGAHLAGIYGCRDCHGANLAGQEMEDAPPFRLVAGNLTPASARARYTVEDWDRAIRHGVRPDGTALFVMPSGAYNKLSDMDTADLIAYLQTLDPVENDMDGVEWKAMGRMLAGGPLDLSQFVYTSAPPATSPSNDSTAAYGAYVAGMMCAYCHGDHLEGQASEATGGLLAPDLRAAGAWAPEQFHQALTTGLTPGGHHMDPEVMPWTSTARMTYAEREGIRRHLADLGPLPAGNAES